MKSPSRRTFLAGSALAGLFLPLPLLAADAIGEALETTGAPVLLRAGAASTLTPAAPLFIADLVRTGVQEFAALELKTATRINLGPESEVFIDRFVAELGGEITIGGPLVLDRPDDLPKIDLTLRSSFAQIGVRGTRIFAGPSRGAYAVFVERGEASVTAAGQTRILRAGEGLSIEAPGAAPGEVNTWAEARIAEVFASVGLTPG